MTTMRRADVTLVESGLFESRAQAVAAIAAGLVTADGRRVQKASTPLAPDAVITARPAHPWVSRGGLKLAAGLDGFGFDPAGCLCLDVGASTGGFTDVLLARGARHVVAVDVGRGQFHARLAGDARVTLLESRDARSLDAGALGQPYELMVCDVSFISLTLVLPIILGLASVRADAVILVKPQFEAGRERVKKGVVRDPGIHQEVCDRIAATVEALDWSVVGLKPSPIEGGDGNREFLLGARRPHV